MKAVILAGGMGTRLGNYTKEIPKPMILLKGKPVLEYQIENLKSYGIINIILVIGHLGFKIKEYFGDGIDFGVNIEYFEENKPLGTGGALYYIKDKLTEDFILAYGDVVFDLNIDRFIDFHRANNGIGTLTVHPNSHPYDSDVLMVGKDEMVEGIIRKNEKRDFFYSNCVNAGIFIFKKTLVEYVLEDKKQDLEKDIISKLIIEKKIYAYRTTEYIKDMGTPDRYELVQKHLEKGIINDRNLSSKQKAIFIDRDGTINKFVGLVYKPEQLELEANVIEGLKLINNSEYISIIITNQPVVARNLCTINELEEIHKKLETVLGEKGVYVDDIFYCPHHPDKGYPEENKNYKISCNCRKPAIGLIKKAAEKYNIDLSSSYFIGDTTVDIQTGRNANLKTILLSTGEGGRDNKFQVKPDFYGINLLEAINKIIEN
ncbi:HAD-IIIA family hydrolase [Clostridium sp.]|uniref:HAD-IIIA family hydrolase n=1 Tax=Clostridium sp. TaxID=1506 RepID=UPI00345D4E06